MRRLSLFAESIGPEQSGHWWHGHGYRKFWRIVWDGKNWSCAKCGHMPFGKTVTK